MERKDCGSLHSVHFTSLRATLRLHFIKHRCKSHSLLRSVYTVRGTVISGGSKGDARDAPPPGPNSFNFMQFWGKFGKIVCWRPLGSWRPLLGEILGPPLVINRYKSGANMVQFVFFANNANLIIANEIYWHPWQVVLMNGFSIGGYKGFRGTRTPLPRHPNSFNFMQFLGNFGKIMCWRPPPEGLVSPPRGNLGSTTD